MHSRTHSPTGRCWRPARMLTARTDTGCALCVCLRGCGESRHSKHCSNADLLSQLLATCLSPSFRPTSPPPSFLIELRAGYRFVQWSYGDCEVGLKRTPSTLLCNSLPAHSTRSLCCCGCRALLKAGADVNLENKYFNTALTNASCNGHTEIVR